MFTINHDSENVLKPMFSSFVTKLLGNREKEILWNYTLILLDLPKRHDNILHYKILYKILFAPTTFLNFWTYF